MWMWVGVAVVVIVVALIVAFTFIWKPASNQTPVSGPAPVYAPQGQLTPGLPKELILDPQAQIGTSYSINYDPTTNQYTARWTSSSSVATLYNEYKTYFGTADGCSQIAVE